MDCQWEDCSDRIKSLNILLRLSEKIENKLSIIKKLLDSHCDKDAAKQLWKFLDSLSVDLDNILPLSENFNSLDTKLHELRTSELEAMKEIDVIRKEFDKANSKKKVEVISRIVSKLGDHLTKIRHLCTEVRRKCCKFHTSHIYSC